MMRQWKRSLAAVLSVVMALSLFVGPVSAAVPMMGADAAVAETAVAEAPAVRLSGVERPAVVVDDAPVVDHDEPAQLMAQDVLDISSVTGTLTSDTTVGNFHILANNGKMTLDTSSTSKVKFTELAETTTQSLKYSGKSADRDKDVISYAVTGASTTNPVPIKVWWNAANSGTLNIAKAGATSWLGGGTDVVDTGTLTITTFNVTEDATYHIGFSANKGFIYRVAVGSAEPTYDLKAADGMTNGTVKFTVDGKEATKAEAGKTVTVTADPDEGYQLDGALTAQDGDGTTVALTAVDGADNSYTFTMPAKAVTVSATFAEQSADEKIAAAVAQVKAALKDYSVAQADVNTQTAAQAAVETAIGLTDGKVNGIATTVTISDFSAATAGDNDTPDGINGSFSYSVVVSGATGEDADITGTVTITATPKAYTKDELNAAMSAAKNEIKKAGAPSAESVFSGKKVVTQEQMDAIMAALSAAQNVYNNSTAAEYGTQVKALTEAAATFAAAVAAATETGTKTDAGAYVLNSADLFAAAGNGTASNAPWTWDSGNTRYNASATTFKAGTSDYFSITTSTSSRLQAATPYFADGFEGTHRLYTATVKFTVPEGSTADVKVWWVSNEKEIKLTTTSVTPVGPVKGVVKNFPATTSWTGLEAGTYTLTDSGQYVFRVEVVEHGPGVSGVTVKDAAGNATAEVAAGGTVQMKATVAPAAAAQTVTWSVSPENQGVTIDANGLVTVASTATKGDYTVTATSTADATKSGTATVTVKVVEVESVTIKQGGAAATTATASVGDTLTLTADVNFTADSAEPADEDNDVTWASSATDVATVDANGKVTALKAGTAKITATSVKDTTKKAELTLTVSEATVTLAVKTKGVNIPSTGREVVFKVGKPGTAAGSVVALPAEVLAAVTVKVEKGGVDVTSSLGVTQKTTPDTGAPMNWNYAMTLPANESGADEVYTVTVSFAGLTDKWAAAGDATATFTVKAPGTPVITLNRHTTEDDDTDKTITSGEKLVLSLDAMVEVDGLLDQTATDNLTFTWTKDDQPITAVDSECQVEGHVGHRQSTYTVDATTSADAGVYKCVIVSTGAESEEITLEVVVEKKTVAAPTTAAFEAATMTLSGVAATMEYSVDEGENWVAITAASVDMTGVNVTPTENIWVRYAETAEAAASEHQLINIDRAATPSLSAGDQAITINNPVAGATYEIKSGDGAWADATVSADGKITGLTNGTAYQVRMKGKGTALTSAAATATPRVDAPDFTPLRDAITAANAAKSGVEESETGADVATSKKWVTPAQMTALNDAITAARGVLNSDTATAQDVATAVTTLNAAVTTFNGQKQDGTMQQETADKDDLLAAIADAEAAAAAVKVSAVGGADVATTKKWVTQDDMDAYTGAIDDAKAVAEDDSATQDDVDDALAALEEATTAFEAAQADGTKTDGGDEPDGPDKTALNAAITAAEAAAQAVEVSTDGADVSKNTQWVNQEAMDAYKTAIEAAKEVAKDNEATQENVTKAVADLAEATTAFEAAQAPGTKAGGGGGRPAIGSGTTPSGDATATNPDGAKVAVSTNKDGVTTAVVTVPSGVDKTTVTIPVAQPSNTLVPVIVNADGTEEIVRMSAVTEDGVALTLDKSVTVKLVDNAKEFVDVPGHWAEKSVDFTTARELFNGTDTTHFTPNAAMTRGMMATVLFRLDGENKGQTAADFTDVADTWYTDAVAWAAEAGVVNGYGNGTFLPEKSINREELAVMVYRYAKALGLGYSAGQEIPDLAYADADQVSEWAYEAISWLTINGVLNGKPGNVVDAAGLASRAEVSTVLERFVKLAK